MLEVARRSGVTYRRVADVRVVTFPGRGVRMWRQPRGLLGRRLSDTLMYCPVPCRRREQPFASSGGRLAASLYVEVRKGRASRAFVRLGTAKGQANTLLASC